ncbi:hypothetical protein N5C38_11810 [Pseudomonas chengduensis]|nr:hypothetical protein [Pseudomonas chengduensis]MDH1211735.1 hypothetical protein [Pseudomonas chengduensis]MDH1280637.1 hypothetical protein [Pseudomonas chengduensis]MDH1681150.1 hypothetical protein [Pseudomonas chengduensis]
MSIDLFHHDYVPAGEPIKKIEHGVIYFVHEGRNAWHSTWVQKYYPGCMHSTEEGAIEYCEERRKNGSVFYIIEIPALITCFNYGKLIATQINTNIPLENYSPQWVAEHTDSDDHRGKEKNRAPSTIEEITASLNTDSIHWDNSQQNNQPVILLWLFDHNAGITPITETSLATYKSVSRGKKYHLDWNRLEKTINPTRIIEIAESFKPDSSTAKIKSISSSRVTKVSTHFCPYEQAVKNEAYSICGRLTKPYGRAVHLQEISKLQKHTYQVKLSVTFFQKITNILYIVTTDSNAKVILTKHVETSSDT